MPSIADLQSYAVAVAGDMGVDSSIVLAQINQESSWNPLANNGLGNVGLGQFSASTGIAYGLTDRTDPYASIAATVHYDADLLAKNGGDYTKMLQSYGTLTGAAGPGSSTWAKFQNLISNIGGEGNPLYDALGNVTGTEASNTNAGYSATGATAGKCGITDISCLISTYGTALLAIIIGVLLIGVGVWGADR